MNTTANTASGDPSFLLVHGAWHQATCWAPLQSALTASGWRSDVVDLPSAGPQSTPAAGMYDDADAVSARLRRQDGPVVVVAHSYGGLPVTQAVAAHPHVTHLVYLSAYLPTEGDSLTTIHAPDSPAPVEEDLNGTIPLVFDDPRTALYGDLSDDLAGHALSQLVEQSRLSFQQRLTRASWRSVPSTYVLCTRDQGLPPELQEKMSANATRVERFDAGHSAFLSAPIELAALLGSVASDTTR